MADASSTEAHKSKMVLPEGVTADIHVYLVSDRTGLEIVASAKGMQALPDMEEAGAIDRLRKHMDCTTDDLSRLTETKDWRVMTRAEIADHLQREENSRGGAQSNDEGAEW